MGGACATPTQSRTPTVRSAPICRTACPPLRPSSMSSTPRPASSHRISSGFHQSMTSSSPREGGDRRIYSPWRNLNVLPQHESPAALEPLPITISTLPVLRYAVRIFFSPSSVCHHCLLILPLLSCFQLCSLQTITNTQYGKLFLLVSLHISFYDEHPSPKAMTSCLASFPLSHHCSKTFYDVPPFGPCTYKDSINTVSSCTPRPKLDLRNPVLYLISTSLTCLTLHI